MLASLLLLLAGLLGVALAAVLLLSGVTCWRLWQQQRRVWPSLTPPISILKPLAGAHPLLYDNLCSLAEQSYPCFEMLCGVEAAHDPACAVVQRLQAAYPQVPIHLVVQQQSLGLNPKINNLASLARQALHPLWLISDANVRVEGDYLQAMARELSDAKVGLVTSTLIGDSQGGLGPLCEDLHMNTFVVSAVCAAHTLIHHACAVGKSLLLRRDIFLQQLGGWPALCNVLAEDYLLGRLFQQHGYRMALSTHRVCVVQTHSSLRDFMRRHARWALMRRRICLSAYCGELLLNPILFGCLLLGFAAGQRFYTALALLGMLGKCLSDAVLLHVVAPQRRRLWHLLVIPGKDVLLAFIWLYGLFCPARQLAWPPPTRRPR